MTTSTIRKAIGAVKDQTSISLAKVGGYVAPDLEVLVVKATSHDKEAADDKYAREILTLMLHSRGYVNACVFAVSKRLRKTSDWIVALKALMLVHKLLNEGGPVFRQEIIFASRKGSRVLRMTDFRDDVHSNAWDHSSFVRAYALYLDHKLETVACGRQLSVGDDDDDDLSDWRREKSELVMFKDLAPEKVLERLKQLLRLISRLLGSRPNGDAKNTRMVLVAVNLMVRDSFRLYDDICDMLSYFLDCFLELEYACSVKAFDTYVNAAKVIDELCGFYDWVKGIGLVRSSEFPQVEKISDQLLGSLEGILKGKANKPKSPKENSEEVSMSEIKLLPPPNEGVLVDLKDDGVSADKEGNKLALALFSTPTNGEWVDFAANGEAKVTSAWDQNGNADWEMVLVESASNLSNQQADLGGGFDSLLLNGMYEHGTVRQYMNTCEMSGGSGSSVAPDGTVQDPFAASLLVPPPSYVQIADTEKKQQLLAQEQQLWQQYASTGMQGHLALAHHEASKGCGLPQHYYTSY